MAILSRMSQLRIDGAVATHAGNVRCNNEDNYCLFGKYRYNMEEKTRKEAGTVLTRRTVVAVYDGMGGEEAGETASLLAARMLVPCALKRIKEDAGQQIQTVNEAICREMKRHGIRMGTTMVALYVDRNTAVCCNIGDSRCYFLRDSVLRQLSVDHSEARRMIEMGVLSEEKARQSSNWHVLTQHLGIPVDEFMIEPHFSQPIALQPDDVFLLCSDGLTDMVSDEEIRKILCTCRNTEEMADMLTGAALTHGGKDNVTALVLQVKKRNTRKGKFSLWRTFELKLPAKSGQDKTDDGQKRLI